jgi:hypothetical protein
MTSEPSGLVEDLSSRYESLRRGALGEPVEPAARSGLTLFLRRGLLSWARACTALPSPVPITDVGRTPTPLPSGQRHDLARLLAGMVLPHIFTPSLTGSAR